MRRATMIKLFQFVGCYLVSDAIVGFFLGDVKSPIKKEENSDE